MCACVRERVCERGERTQKNRPTPSEKFSERENFFSRDFSLIASTEIVATEIFFSNKNKISYFL